MPFTSLQRHLAIVSWSFWLYLCVMSFMCGFFIWFVWRVINPDAMRNRCQRTAYTALPDYIISTWTWQQANGLRVWLANDHRQLLISWMSKLTPDDTLSWRWFAVWPSERVVVRKQLLIKADYVIIAGLIIIFVTSVITSVSIISIIIRFL